MGVVDLAELDLNEGQEPKCVEADEEYQLRIVGVTEGEDKNELKYFMPRFEIINEPFSKDFTHFFHYPNKEKMSAKQLNNARFNLKVFLQACGVDPTSRFNIVDDLPGKTCWAILGVRDGGEYGEQNFVRKFIAPR